MGILADEFVRVRPELSGIAGPVKRGLGLAGAEGGKTFSQKFSEHTKDIVKGLGITLAAVEIIKVVKDTFKESVAASREQASLNRVTQNVIRTTGDVSNVTFKHVQDLAGALAKQAGVTKEVVQGGENLLLTFGKVRNQLGKGNDIFDRATSDALDLSKALGVSMPAASTKVGKALNDPVHGLTALSKAGITFTDQQKAQIKTMVSSGNILGAQKVILAELEKRYKGTAAAAATPADRMHAAWHELLVTLGDKITPVLDRLSKLFADKVLPAIESILNGTSSWNKAISNTVTQIKAVVSSSAPLQILIYGIVAAMTLYIATSTGVWVVSKAIDGAAKAWKALNAAIKANWIILVIGLIVGALIYAYKHFQGFRDVVNQVWATVQTVMSAAWNGAIKPILAALAAAFKALLPVLSDLWTKGFQPLLSTVGGAFTQLYNTAIKPYSAQIKIALEAIGAAVLWLANNVVIPYIKIMIVVFRTEIQIAIVVIQILIAAIKILVGAIIWWITNVTIPLLKILIAAVTFAIVNVIIPTIHGLITAFNAIVTAVINMRNWMVDAWNAAWTIVIDAWHGIHTAWVAMVGFMNTIAQTAINLWNTTHDVWSNIIGWISSAYNGTIARIWSLMVTAMHLLQTTSLALWNTIHDAWSNIISWIASAYNGTIARIWNAAIALMHLLQTTSNALWTTVHDVWGKITGWVASAWNGTIKPTWNAITAGIQTLATWIAWLRDRFNDAFNKIKGFANTFRTTLKTVFTNAVNDVAAVWSRMESVMMTPVNWVIQHVYTDGIKKLWDGVAGLVGLPKMPPIGAISGLPKLPHLAGGGVVPGLRDPRGRDDRLAMMTRGEGVLTVGEMDKLGGPRGFSALRGAIAGYDGGGIIGGAASAIGHFFGSVKNKAFEILSNVAGGGLKLLAKPIEALAQQLPGSGSFVDALKKMPEKLLDKVISVLTDKAKAATASESFGGAGIPAVLKFLQSINGRVPYSLGAVGPGAYDCSGLVGEVWARLTGHPSYRRYFVTGGEKSFLESHGFTRGADENGLTVGFRTTNPDGHTTGSLAGHTFEAAHTGTTMRFDHGQDPRSFPNVYHLAAKAFVGGGTAGGKLGDWIKRAVQIVGKPSTWEGPLHTLVMRESGGNPNAVNRTDINARNGTPSKGLAQVIQPTFDRYHNTSLSSNIFDPIANLVAALDYIIVRYGSIFNVQQADEHKPPRGYRLGGIIGQIASMDKGGWLTEGWNLIHNGLGRPEPVGDAIGLGSGNVFHVTIDVDTLQEIRDIEDFLNRMQQSARAKKG